MSKKKAKVSKRLMALGGAMCLAISILNSPISALQVQAASGGDEMIQPYKDDIQWRFKIENNKIYKRLYNYSTANWVGDWIFVRDL